MPILRGLFSKHLFVVLGATVLANTAFGQNGQESAGTSAAPGVFEDRILFGQSAAFEGPAKELGRSMQAGILAAFKEINDQGGIHGRRLDLKSLNDSYEPGMAIANTRQLVEEGAFALIGAVGTPTSKAVVPVTKEHHIPYMGPMTGAEFLRDSAHHTVINLRASYYQETEEMVQRLTTDRGIKRIAILYQDDSFGRAGLRGVLRALEKRKLFAIGTAVFSRNTVAVKTALLDLQAAEPEAVIIIGPYEPTATFIKWAHRLGMDPVFMTLSFVGSNALAKELGAGGAGVLVTQVVPFPTGDTIPVSAAYRAALKAYDPSIAPGFISFEGYLAGRLAIYALQRCGRQVERDCIHSALRSGDNIDLDGFTLRFSRHDNQGSDRVFLTAIGPDGQYMPLATLPPR
ncbi:MAG: ABC transporter substrate-binding protein [Gammaproteobacteria bacterium]|nr:ABC transporter substrate-binding protein [Gammaproteobacteria bacterium]